MPKTPTLEELLKAGLHFGHRASRWHPKMKPYIFTKRDNIHIIDLEKTQKLLDEALGAISKLAKESKTILFVGTKDHVKEHIKGLAKETGMPYAHEKWLGGTLTNFSVIKKLIKKYKDLLDGKATGKFKKYTKKEQLDFDREIEKLEIKVGGLVDLIKEPEAIFIWDPKEEATALREAKRKGILVFAICDTNVNPDGVDYIIPANDDATKGIKLILGLVGKAIKEGKNK